MTLKTFSLIQFGRNLHRKSLNTFLDPVIHRTLCFRAIIFDGIRDSQNVPILAIFDLDNRCLPRNASSGLIREPQLTIHKLNASTCEGLIWIASKPCSYDLYPYSERALFFYFS